MKFEESPRRQVALLKVKHDASHRIRPRQYLGQVTPSATKVRTPHRSLASQMASPGKTILVADSPRCGWDDAAGLKPLQYSRINEMHLPEVQTSSSRLNNPFLLISNQAQSIPGPVDEPFEVEISQSS